MWEEEEGRGRKHMRVALDLAKLYGKTEFRTTDKRRIDERRHTCTMDF